MRDLPSHANFDPALCLATGLFRSIQRGTRATKLAIDWPKKDQPSSSGRTEAFRFRSDVLLGADDLRVLQGVLAFAKRDPLRITSARRGELGRLHDRLKLQGCAKDGHALLVQLGYAELARAVGYGNRNGRDLHGGGLSAKIKGSLKRLAGLSVTWSRGELEARWQLLTWDAAGPRDRRLRVALNPRAGGCALGNPPFARIDLAIARELGSDPARIMHQRLSAWMGRAGEPRKISIDSLVRYAWDSEEPGSGCPRKRRSVAKLAVAELRTAGWRIDEVANDPTMLVVYGPRAGVQSCAAGQTSQQVAM